MSKSISVSISDVRSEQAKSLAYGGAVSRSEPVSFAETAFGMVTNRGFEDRLGRPASPVLKSISAIANEFGQVIYDNVVNYLDGVGNVDYCKAIALMSYAKELGVDYSIFDKIRHFPAEVIELLDVFSINPEYMVSAGFFGSGEIVQAISAETVALSAAGKGPSYDLSGAPDLSTAFTHVAFACFFNTISAAVTQKYTSDYSAITAVPSISADFDDTANFVYKNISAELFNKAATSADQASRITEKNLYGVSLAFDQDAAADAIYAGLSSYSDFSEGERRVISSEVARRRAVMHTDYLSAGDLACLPTTRYARYRERQVKDYANFVVANSKTDSDALRDSSVYDFDDRYIVVSGDAGVSTLIDPASLSVCQLTIEKCANNMVDIAKQLRNIRYQLREIPQKYYVRGSWLLLNYLINEEVAQYVDESRLSNVHVGLTQYYDNTEYFNLKTNTTSSAVDYMYANSPYFDQPLSEKLIDIDRFYEKSVQEKHGPDLSDGFAEFLDVMYRRGASKSYVASAGELTVPAESAKPVALKYFGREIGYQPWVNHKNRTHPSYQVHPCLYNLARYANAHQMVQRAFNSTMTEEYRDHVIRNLSGYVGEYGNVLCAWNNRIDEFFGYDSRWEHSDHRLPGGNEHFLVDYDGPAWFDALSEFLKDKTECVTALSTLGVGGNRDFYNKYYSHLRLKPAEARFFAHALSAVANELSGSLYDSRIMRYSVDAYHTNYVLTNDGKLWVRPQGHPLPVRLFSKSDDDWDGLVQRAFSGRIDDIEFNKDMNVIAFKSNGAWSFGKLTKKYNDMQPRYYEYGVDSVESSDLENSDFVVKYENCVGVAKWQNSPKFAISVDLYDSNTALTSRATCHCDFKYPDSNGLCVACGFDTIYVAAVSSAGLNGKTIPYYAKSSGTLCADSQTSGSMLFVDEYDFPSVRQLKRRGRKYFSAMKQGAGYVQILPSVPYAFGTGQDDAFVELLSSGQFEDRAFPYGRLVRDMVFATDAISDQQNSCLMYASGTGQDGAFVYDISGDQVLSVLNCDGELAYRLSGIGDVRNTGIGVMFQTEDDLSGRQQFAISCLSVDSYVRLFEGRLSALAKCSEQDWTKYYDATGANAALSALPPLSSELTAPSDRYTVVIDDDILSVWLGKEDNSDVVYVNYANSARSADGEMPFNSYLKLLPGAGGVVAFLDRSGTPNGRSAYVKNLSDGGKPRMAVYRMR